MSAHGSGQMKRTAGQVDAGRHGEVSVEMTAQDVLSLAVNFAQNKWPVDKGHSTAMRVMLDEIYEQVLEANRLAVEKRLANQGLRRGAERVCCDSATAPRSIVWQRAAVNGAAVCAGAGRVSTGA